MAELNQENRLKLVTTPRELIDYQTREALRHIHYYHYTTWTSLEKILKNRTFLFTRVSALFINDLQEAKDRDQDMCSRTYIASFAFGTSEMMPMWGLYCLPPSEAVRICIPRQKMQNWLNSIRSVRLWYDDGPREVVEGVEVSLIDIIYGDGLEGDTPNLTHNGNHFNASNQGALHKLTQKPELVGNIKRFAWSYENEVRLKIVLPEPKDGEKDSRGRADRIMVEIPEKSVNGFRFTTGPNFGRKNDPLYEDLEKQRLNGESRIANSKYAGMLNYRTLCDVCAHGSFEKKEETSQK